MDFKKYKNKKMKKTILISFLLLSFNLFYTQGTSYNLGFSQVLNYEYNSVLVQDDDELIVGTITVPTNKVWKITSGSSSRSDDTGADCSICVNNHIVFRRNYNYNESNTPIWLSSGTYSIKLKNHETSTDRYLDGSLSIVEFNIE